MTGTSLAALGFAALALAAVVLEVAARRRPEGAPLGMAVGAAMRTTTGRVVVLAAWLWLGLHFLAR